MIKITVAQQPAGYSGRELLSAWSVSLFLISTPTHDLIGNSKFDLGNDPVSCTPPSTIFILSLRVRIPLHSSNFMVTLDITNSHTLGRPWWLKPLLHSEKWRSYQYETFRVVKGFTFSSTFPGWINVAVRKSGLLISVLFELFAISSLCAAVKPFQIHYVNAAICNFHIHHIFVCHARQSTFRDHIGRLD